MKHASHVNILVYIISLICPTIISYYQGIGELQELINTATQGSNPIFVFDDNHERHVRILLNMTNSPYWVYTTEDFAASLEQIMTMTMETNPPEDFYAALYFVIFCRTECINSVLLSATVLDGTVGQRSLLRHFSTWLIISSDLPSNVNATLDHVAWIQIDEQRRQYFNEIAPPSKEKDTEKTSLKGFFTLMWMQDGRAWTSVDTKKATYSSIFTNFKRGLNGRQLTASTLEWSPFTIRRVVDGIETYVGAAVDMFDILAETLNFSYVLEEPEDKSWGIAYGNISLTGIIAQINRAEVDFCIVPYAVSTEREKFADISYPAMESRYNALYRRIEDNNGWMFPISCFSWNTYVAGAVVWGLVICLSFIQKLASNELSLHGSGEFNMRFLLEIGFSIPLRQNIETLNLEWKASSRILIFSWCITCFLITTVYVGNLVAFATIEKRTDPFDTLEDISNQNEYGVFVMEGGYAEGAIMTSNNPVMKNLKKKMIPVNSSVYNDPSKIVQHLMKEKNIFLSPMVFTDVLKSLSCDIVQAKQSFFLLFSGFLFPPFSPLKRIFENQFVRLQEYGTVDKLMRKWSPKALQCNKSDVMNPRFELRNLTLIGVVVAVLLSLALVVLLCELILFKRI